MSLVVSATGSFNESSHGTKLVSGRRGINQIIFLQFSLLLIHHASFPSPKTFSQPKLQNVSLNLFSWNHILRTYLTKNETSIVISNSLGDVDISTDGLPFYVEEFGAEDGDAFPFEGEGDVLHALRESYVREC